MNKVSVVDFGSAPADAAFGADSPATGSHSPGDAGDISKRTFISLVVITAITPLILLVAPAAAQQLAVELGLSPSQVGTYFFVELAAFSLGTVPSYWWMHRVDGRRVGLLAAIVLCGGNLLTTLFTHGFSQLLAIRAITGLAAGTLNVLCLSTATQARNPDRLFGVSIVGQLVVGAVALWITPRLFGEFGIDALYVGIGVLAIATVPAAWQLPTFLEKAVGARRVSGSGTARTEFGRAPAILVPLGLLLFYIAMGSVWTFASGAATLAGLGGASVGRVLSVATLMGIAGAFIAAFIGGRVKRTAVLWLGYGAMVASIAALGLNWGTAVFIAAILLFKFGWTFVLPFIFAAASRVSTPRLLGSVSLFVGAGLSVGPLLGGIIIERFGGPTAMFWGAAAVTGISALVVNRIAVSPSQRAA